MPYQDYTRTTTVNGKLITTGSIFSTHRGVVKTLKVKVPVKEAVYLIQISLTMLAAMGGDFDEEDAVYADIYSIDGRRMDTTNGFGGVWDGHFGAYGNYRNQAISSYVGYASQEVIFRLCQSRDGDNWIGATYTIQQL